MHAFFHKFLFEHFEVFKSQRIDRYAITKTEPAAAKESQVPPELVAPAIVPAEGDIAK